MSTLSAAAVSMHGTLHGGDATFDGVSTDTRTLRRGELFFALDGPNFDGRDFVSQAQAKGAAGAVVSNYVDDNDAKRLSQVVVGDSRQALGRLGAAWRDMQPAVVVGITGSNGKTTLKEMVAACLSRRASTIATQGNLNNDIGMPLMMTRIESSHRYAVLEMGANHAGEIAYLAALAKPDVVVITNAAAAHLEGFGSVDGVARAKGEILCGERRPRIAVLNADDHYFEYWSTLVADAEIVSFGIDDKADVSATDIVAQAGGSTFTLRLPDATADVALPLAGRHNVRNACAAAAVAYGLAIDVDDIRAGLESVRPVSGRLTPLPGVRDTTVYDDSYNANPLSVVAAAEFLATLDGRNVLVLGDMGELGADAPRLHRETGEKVREAGVERLFATGGLSRTTVDGFGDNGTWFSSQDKLIEALRANLAGGENVLVKGSRSTRMERVVEALRAGKAAGGT